MPFMINIFINVDVLWICQQRFVVDPIVERPAGRKNVASVRGQSDGIVFPAHGLGLALGAER